MKLDEFVRQTKRDHRNRMYSVEDLVSRKPSAQDWVDAAVIGGVSLADALAANITDADLDPQLLAAFHAQYPNEVGFVEKIQTLSDDPEALQGLVSGVKGKLFEQQYVDTLNDGGFLPEGHIAELAGSPVQEGWDVVVKNADGEVVEQLQLKMTESLSYVKEALERYPEFDIVLPTEVFEEFSTNSDIAAHLVDSGIRSADVMDPITDGLDLAQAASPDLIPELAFVFIAASAAYSVYRGKDKKVVWKETRRRAVKAAITGGISGLAAFAVDPFVALPVATAVRLAMSRHEVSTNFADETRQAIRRIDERSTYVFQTPRSPSAPRILPPSQLDILIDGAE